MTSRNLLALLLCAGNIFGGVRIYTTQSDFDAASTVFTQTFEGLAAVRGMAARSRPNGLTHEADPAILPGLRIDATTWLGGDLAVSGAAVFANYGRQGAALDLSFAGVVNAVSLHVVMLPIGAASTVSVYSNAGTLMGTYRVDAFIGFKTTGKERLVRYESPPRPAPAPGSTACSSDPSLPLCPPPPPRSRRPAARHSSANQSR